MAWPAGEEAALWRDSKPSLIRLWGCTVAQSSNSFDTLDCGLPGSLSMECPRQGYWSGGHFLLQGVFPALSCVSAALGGGVFLPVSHLRSCSI